MIKLKQYRDIWMSEKFDEIIGFYPREFYPLDNFSSFKVKVNGYLYSSLEEAFQSMLFLPDHKEISEQENKKIKVIIVGTKEENSSAVGKVNKPIIGICDNNLSKGIIKSILEEINGE